MAREALEHARACAAAHVRDDAGGHAASRRPATQARHGSWSAFVCATSAQADAQTLQPVSQCPARPVVVHDFKGQMQADASCAWCLPSWTGRRSRAAGLTSLDGRGTEADEIAAFKDKLELSDEDAALAHLAVGRRLLRAQYEAGGRDADAPARKVLSCSGVDPAPARTLRSSSHRERQSQVKTRRVSVCSCKALCQQRPQQGAAVAGSQATALWHCAGEHESLTAVLLRRRCRS